MNDLAPILTAIARVRDECGHIEKDGYNDFHKYHYVSESALAGAVRPLMAAHGLVIIQGLAIDPPPRIDEHGVTHLVLEFTLAHESGVVWPEKFRVACSGNDRDSKGKWSDKGAYKANTGGYKYFLNRLFMVDTGDDPEREKKPKPTPRSRGKQGNQPSGGDGVKLASESQVGMLKAKSYSRAEELGEAGDYESIHEYAGAIRRVAMDMLGFKDVNSVTFAGVTPMAKAIEAAVLDNDGKIRPIEGGTF